MCDQLQKLINWTNFYIKTNNVEKEDVDEIQDVDIIEESEIEEPIIESGTTETEECDNTEETIETPVEVIVTPPKEEILELLLERIYTCPTYTIGKLYIDGKYFCDTIEDTDRNLFDSMPLEEIKAKKVYGETAIPCGTYDITMNVRSSKYSDFKRYTWAKPYNAYIPRLLNVKAYDGILIHVLNYATDSLGCIGVGVNKSKGSISESTTHFYRLMDQYMMPAKEKGIKIKITIRQNY